MPDNKPIRINNNCVHFRGDIPCLPHKKHGVHCDNCSYFQPFNERILIIKLGAAGDVIRTTPILRRLRREFPQAEITWLTHTPLFVPAEYVQNILTWTWENILWLQNREFDLLINLDKDKEALALAKSIPAKIKKGYLPDEFGKCSPADADSVHKWQTGLWDDFCQRNRKSYPQEIFEMLGYKFQGEKYLLDLPEIRQKFALPTDKKIIGLNTGCGTRWLTRLWGENNWIDLSNQLHEAGYLPLLLGGAVEDKMNLEIAASSHAVYLGHFDLPIFLNLVNCCDLVVTSVTMAMHIAIAFEKKLILLNNIFNRYEFDLYGLGKILEPAAKNCLGCYKNSCEEKCMSTIPVDLVLQTIRELLPA
ncbi:MAG TPA: glycosyltransferase family 9 protein [Candidatus Cloacimonadota bacterium]|nr:glycosyltransferase family 9 protein [Candidatus Cloacimonadota bacterium]